MKLYTYLLIGVLSTASFSALSAAQEMDKISVIVNDDVILQSDVASAIKKVHLNAKQNNQTLPTDATLRQQVIEKLILDDLQLQQAKRIGVVIDDDQLTNIINNIAAKNNKSIAELKQAVEQSKINWQAYREEIRKEVMITEARNAMVRQRINILPDEVNNLAKLLNQQNDKAVDYKISHIQLRVDDQNHKKDVEASANELVSKLKAGQDFAKTAYSVSKGPKALNGGDWGWMRKEEMPTIFADQIDFPQKGQIIGPFLSGSGYHILKIDDIKGLQSVSVTEVDARHILIKPSIILSDTAAQKELRDISEQIKSGKTTFAQMAKKYSQDLGSGAKGGDLGYQLPSLYVPEFKAEVEKLPIGVISQPFKTMHGWHIVEVLGRRDIDKTDTAMQDKAYQILFNRKFNEEAETWLQELRASAIIDVLPENTSNVTPL